MARTIFAGRLAFGQLDFFESGSRKTGIAWSDLQMNVFVDGNVLPWGMANGDSAVDSNIGAGLVYFNEVVGASGFYLIRFYPDRTGFWRIVVKHPVLGTEVINEFDAAPLLPPVSGLRASFAS